ncbi:hypothetical protein BV898_07094 [Hypsibius exemplaris]|uniref:Uncharacterized protein n=1 Tax=Hypsibius exemplaris TaxID=2072580 RepID=A0A1W0WUF1_HYPEX|nr:hypothetical protein BV898_07094 [Hypsibius exemplaris]
MYVITAESAPGIDEDWASRFRRGWDYLVKRIHFLENENISLPFGGITAELQLKALHGANVCWCQLELDQADSLSAPHQFAQVVEEELLDTTGMVKREGSRKDRRSKDKQKGGV